MPKIDRSTAASAAIRSTPDVVIVGPADHSYGQIHKVLVDRSVSVDRWSGQRLGTHLRHDARVPAAAPGLYIFNLVDELHRNWWEAVGRLSAKEPEAGIVIAMQEPDALAIQQAVDAGASEFIWQAELGVEPIVWSRLYDTLRERIASIVSEPKLRPRRRWGQRSTTGSDLPMKSTGDVPVAARVIESPAARITEDERALALKRIDDGVARLPTTEARRQPLADVMAIAVPELRSRNGRLDSSRIADRLGVSVAQLAKLSGVSRQALSKMPDSPTVQPALDPIARSLSILDAVLPPAGVRKWLGASHPMLGDEAPLAVILDRRGESVARLLESAREGLVD